MTKNPSKKRSNKEQKPVSEQEKEWAKRACAQLQKIWG